MITLSAIQEAFINTVRTTLEEAFKNGTNNSTILPIYKYRDPIFNNNTLTELDPAYPPYDTTNPTLRESTKIPFLNLLASFLVDFSNNQINYATLPLGSGIGPWNHATIPNMQAGKDLSGMIHITGGLIATSSVSSNSVIAMVPYEFPFPMLFTGTKNNAPFTLTLGTNGYIYNTGGSLNTNDWVSVHFIAKSQ